MAGRGPMGSFRLKPGIRLMAMPEGGVILQPHPLRALKINRSAFEILDACRPDGAAAPAQKDVDGPAVLGFLDTFHQGGLLEWTPPSPRDLPSVSIVIPVYNRAAEIEECLASLAALDYPADKIEVIVVDDASRDCTVPVVRRFDVRLIIQPWNRGQSAARNTGVAAATGEVIAFLDSDCIARPEWLRELVPYFQDPRVALVGGAVAAHYREKRMDRYEEVCSALNMGPVPVMGRGDRSVVYVPTCNMLVRKSVYEKAGGLDEGLHVGEDVDLCWRVMAAGHHLHYLPRGTVRHKHRNRLLAGWLRRFDYGTSEAVLYDRFPKIAKQFPWQPAGLAMILAVAAPLVFPAAVWLLGIAAGIPVVEAVGKRYRLAKRMGIRLPVPDIFAAVVKSHFQLADHLAFYLVRYYLLLLIALTLVLPSLAGLFLGIVLLPTLTAYVRKRPRLCFPEFAFFYLAEHAFYQSGAFWGCLKEKHFRLYGISFRHAGFMPRPGRSGRRRPVVFQKKPAPVGKGSV